MGSFTSDTVSQSVKMHATWKSKCTSTVQEGHNSVGGTGFQDKFST